MRRFLTVFLVVAMAAWAMTGCGLYGEETRIEAINKTAAICIPSSTNADFTDIRDQLTQALAAEGYTIQAIDAGMDSQNMINQIQNFKVSNVGFLYVIPVGDPAALKDVLNTAADAGIKTLVSHSYTGKGTATAFVLSDEFTIGVMMAPMVTQWISRTFPTAGPGSIKVAVFEQSMTQDMIKRSVGMKIIAEKFLRKIDLSNGQFIKTKGAAAIFTDVDGTEKAVTEPTGGLILNADGRAQLNPFYDARISLIEFDNQSITSSEDAKTAIDDAFMAYPDIKAVMCFDSDTARGANDEMIARVESGSLTESLSNLAVFGADKTASNIESMIRSATQASLLRGVVTHGGITSTIVETAIKIIRGEGVPAQFTEQPGYLTFDADGQPIEVIYNSELPPTADFID